MNQVNMHEAKTQLSKLVAKAAQGEPFVIAKAGKPLVKVTAIEKPKKRPERKLGFMKGQMVVPKDFKAFGREEMEEMFGFKFGEGE